MSHPRSVLLVDDSKFARLLIKAFIESGFPGWSVDEAAEANSAQQKADSSRYDYFVIDFNMPGKNGLELGADIRRQHPDATVALLTANIQQDIQNQAEALGMDFIAKPPTQEKITAYFSAKEAAHD
ncbi:response regulator receiver protein [Thalassospira profundimaris]|uniref:Response regulator receiver protein n=1 Tax=Thalassospira profundimaris TaxID=502049 RepID=A0A367X026_9PROT|nr:response regulator [Thalassospira profundimaris]RCK47035.1 response regulator receiver protein [Thalassospira profundimaris]